MTETKTEEKPQDTASDQPSSNAATSSQEAHHPAPTHLVAPHQRTAMQRFKHALMRGGEQTAFCISTDLAEPLINKMYQNTHGDKNHTVTSFMTYAAEFAGDGAALVTFVGIKTFFAKQVNWLVSGMRALASPVLNWQAERSTRRWAEEHQVDKDDPRYKERFEQYKTLGAEAVVDSGIIASTATAFNLVAQKHLFKNEQSYMTMFKGKLFGIAATFAAMGVFGIFFPRAKRKVEKTVETHMMDPMIGFMKNTLGIEEEIDPAITKTPQGQALSADIPLSPEKREGLLIMVAEHAQKIDWNNPEQRAGLLAKQKSVYQAFINVFQPEGALVNKMTEEHYEVMHKAHGAPLDNTAETRLHDKAASRMSVQASMTHKRRDMQQFIALLDDAKFLEEVGAVIKSGKLPERRNTSITSEQKKYMSESLLKNSKKGNVADMAEEQALDYKALAHALEPEGSCARVLAAELKKQLPAYDPADVDGIAKDYMQYYQKEALSMVREFKSDSPVVQHAVERASAIKNRFHTQPSQTSYATSL